MTTERRKRQRLLEKVTKLGSRLIAIKAAPQGSSRAVSKEFDPDAVYISKRTLIELLNTKNPEENPFEHLERMDPKWDKPRS